MCGRYYVEADDMTIEIVKVMEDINRRRLNRQPGPEVRPTDYAPVVLPGRVTAMQWGFTLPDRRTPIINARSETAADKPLFAACLPALRCLLPASGYFEWDRAGSRYTIGRDKPVYLAGIFRQEDDRVPRFCILTQPPIEALSFIHDRMPVLLSSDAARAYLSGSLAPRDAQRFVPQGVIPRTDAAQLSFL